MSVDFCVSLTILVIVSNSSPTLWFNSLDPSTFRAFKVWRFQISHIGFYFFNLFDCCGVVLGLRIAHLCRVYKFLDTVQFFCLKTFRLIVVCWFLLVYYATIMDLLLQAADNSLFQTLIVSVASTSGKEHVGNMESSTFIHMFYWAINKFLFLFFVVKKNPHWGILAVVQSQIIRLA